MLKLSMKGLFRIGIFQLDGLGFESPLDAIGTASDVQMWNPIHAFGAKHSDEFAFEGNDGAVVDSCDAGKRTASDDGIGVVSPDNVWIAGRFWLPGYIRDGRCIND